MKFFKGLLLLIVVFVSGYTQASVSSITADTKSGLILSGQNASALKYPASLTKVMTLYMTFSAIEKGLLKMDDMLPVSHRASRQPRSKLYVRPGQKISVRDAINALIVLSANDVAVVLAEALAPSEADFAHMMTKTARQLGLKSTVFRNASGLHHRYQVTTAQDMAVLAIAMINHFPEHYKLFSAKTFTYKGKTYRSHNHVQRKYKGAEGLKTGYISAVGFNIISTAKRGDYRLVSVVIGQDSVALRDRQVMRQLDKGFQRVEKQLDRLNKGKINPYRNVLNKKAVLNRPDLSDAYYVMASRLDNILHYDGTHSRTTLLALNPHKPIETPFEDEETYMAMNDEMAVEQGSNIEAEEAEEKKLEAQEEELIQTSLSKGALQAGFKTESLNLSDDLVLSPNTNVAHFENADLNKDIAKELTENMPSLDVVYTPEKPVVAEVPAPTEAPKVVAEAPVPVVAEAPASTEAPVVAEVKKTKPTPKVSLTTFNKKASQKSLKTWGIQVGAFSNKSKAKSYAQKVIRDLGLSNKTALTEPSKNLYRSRIFGFSTKNEAQKACSRLKSCMVY